MSHQAQTILSAASALSEEDRIRLIESLLQTLGTEEEAASNDEIEAAWMAEAERRADELDRGVAKAIPWSEVRAAGEALFHAKD